MPLGKNADAGDYIRDFEKSDAPQFKGKSKEKRRKMAIAAYLDSKDKKESKMKSFDDLRAELQEVNVDRVKRRIDQEKKRDDLKHDRMLNRARMRDKMMNDELDHNDKPFVKDLVKKLRGGSKTHAKQADDLEKALKTEAEEVKPHMMYDPKTGKGVMAKDKADHDRLAKMGYTHDKPEDIKEISSNKLGDYMRKSAADAAKRGPGQSARRQDKRIAGQSMADKKIRKKMGYSSDAKVPAGKNEDAKKFATADKMNYKKTNMNGAPSNVEEQKMDSAAMKKAMDVFKKRGGKITKVAPGKAAGYHGKDDPGKDMKGMMDKGDTKSFKKNKFVRSMK